MKRGSTLFLRTVIFLIGLPVLFICIFVLPRTIMSEIDGDFDYGPMLIALYVASVPFFIALHQALKLLSNIDSNKAFSKSSVTALKNIKYCALAISGSFALIMPYMFHIADIEDAPGVAALGFVVVAAAFVIATFAGVLQKLIQNAVDIKSENDLTV